MKIRIATLITAAVFLAPAASTAAPILPGGWEPIGTMKVDGAIFWKGPSAECVDCSTATLITSFGPIDYLYSEAMGFTYFHVTRPAKGRTSGVGPVAPEPGRSTQSPQAGLAKGSPPEGLEPGDLPLIEHLPFADNLSIPNDEALPVALPEFPPDVAEAWGAVEGVTGIELDQRNVGSTSRGEQSDAPSQILQVPEPSMALLLGIGVIGLRARRFRR
jgi:hypothetical protein